MWNTSVRISSNQLDAVSAAVARRSLGREAQKARSFAGGGLNFDRYMNGGEPSTNRRKLEQQCTRSRPRGKDRVLRPAAKKRDQRPWRISSKPSGGWSGEKIRVSTGLGIGASTRCQQEVKLIYSHSLTPLRHLKCTDVHLWGWSGSRRTRGLSLCFAGWGSSQRAPFND